MCLSLFDHTYIEANDEISIKYSKYFKNILILHGILIFLNFLTLTKWLDALCDLVILFYMYNSIQVNQYDLNTLFFYLFYCLFNFISTMATLGAYLNDANFVIKHQLLPHQKWQYTIFIYLIYITPIIYFLITLIGYQLYQSLTQQVSFNASSSYSSYGSILPTRTRTFQQPFQGQGHHLNE